MQNTDTLIDTYIAMWNETSRRRRRELVARTVADDARYVDPLMQGEGIDGISAMIGAAQAQLPGHRFALGIRPRRASRSRPLQLVARPGQRPARRRRRRLRR